MDMSNPSSRVNVILDDEHALKLRRLAERTHTNPGTIARSLLSTALEEADPDPRDVAALLDRIPGAFESAQRGLAEARTGRSVPLEDL
jgi:predicted transcriptional regulator